MSSNPFFNLGAIELGVIAVVIVGIIIFFVGGRRGPEDQ